MEKHMESEIAAINQQSLKDKIKSYMKHPGSFRRRFSVSGGVYFNPRYPVLKTIAVCMDI